MSTGLHLAKSTEALDHKSTLPKYSYSDSKPLVVLSTMASFLFLIVVHLFDIGEIPKGLQFNILYLSVNLLLTVLLIIIAHFITLKSWKYGLDPDNTSLPLLTAIADLIGTILIVGALHSQHD